MRVVPIAALVAAFFATASNAQIPSHFAMPAEITYPEGIAWDGQTSVYVAASASGQLARVDTRTGYSHLIGSGLAPQIGGLFPGILGLRLDEQGRLWMAGGRTGRVFVVEAATGALIQTIAPPDTTGSLINDIAFARGKAFYTDTLKPVLWAADAGAK